MKKLPDIDVQLGSVFDLMNGQVKAQLLLTAVELRVFDRLSSPKTAPQVAAELETHPTNTGFLLDALAAVDLLHKENGLYWNKPETEAVFDRQSPAYLGEMPIMMQRMTGQTIAAMTRLIQEGPPSSSDCANLGAEEVWESCARYMAGYQCAGTAQKMAAIVSELDEFLAFNKMLDLGGGPGLHCIAMVAEHPSMQGVIFDQPSVVKVAREFIAQYEMEDRVSVIGGDYVNDPIGDGYDLIWASATLNLARHDLDSMFRKIYEALTPGGIFISLADGVTHERTQPARFVLGCLSYSLSGLDMMFNKGEIPDAMLKAGFASVNSMTVDTSHMPMELDIARKAK